MAIEWQHYQEKTALFFRSIGLNATTDVPVKGVRTSHNVDVLVKTIQAGFEATWIVECKHWKTRVSKLHVLALREIISDVGADRGILLSEEGFQSGAIEAAILTNVRLTSLAELRISAANDIYEARFYDLLNRIHDCNARYWAISKYDRIEHDLRPDIYENSYSGARVIDLVNGLLSLAFRRRYPFKFDGLASYALSNIPKEFGSPKEVFEVLDPAVNELEGRLTQAETKLANKS
ncbi:MAG TPA: restriction endonuclease [Pseudomonadales bacterium]|nr:restriction endonuclease [Pseudomonadales bacterium]